MGLRFKGFKGFFLGFLGFLKFLGDRIIEYLALFIENAGIFKFLVISIRFALFTFNKCMNFKHPINNHENIPDFSRFLK
jgi:hypothetical protein